MLSRNCVAQFFPDGGLESGPVLTSTISLPPKPTPCLNGGLELNNLTNWNQYCGDFADPINSLVPCTDINRAKTVGVGTDPYCGFPKVYKGNYSLKLGNNLGGNQADLVYYPITVTTANKNFMFRYALVMEDPSGHTSAEKPSFTYYCTLGNKNTPNMINIPDKNLFLSTLNTVVADRGNPYWSSLGDIVYKKWVCVNIDLSAYVGQTVSICFYVKDCSLGGHFGYAYIDGLCEPDMILPQFTLPNSYCNNGLPLIANGTSSLGEESHFWEITESDYLGNVGAFVASDWFVAQPAGIFNITNWLNSKHISLKCNRFYRVKLAVGSGCTPWRETTKIFKYTCPYIYNEPDKNICCPIATVSGATCVTLGQNPVIEEPGMPLPELSYSWSQAPNYTQLANTPQYSPCINHSSQYVLTVTDENGCRNTDTVNINFRGPLEIETISQIGCCPNNFGANVLEKPCSVFDLTSGGYPLNINWTTNVGGSSQVVSNTSNFSPINTSGGTYILTVSSPCHIKTASIVVPAQDPGFPDLIMPNALNVNSVIYTNNKMIIQEYGISAPFTGQPAYNADAYELFIFNRWGSVIRVVTEDNNSASDNPPHNNPRCILQGEIFWDAKDRFGTTVSQNDYVWKLRLRNKCTGQWSWMCTSNGHVPAPQCKDWCIIWPHWWQPIWTCCNWANYGSGCAYNILVLH